MVNKSYKKYPTIGCCGIDCGLCPRYYTEGSSRCPGCFDQQFYNHHPTCSFITCCVKNNNLETCGNCDDFPCIKFDAWFGENAYDSFVTHKKIALLKLMLSDFNDGSAKNYFCLAAALLSIKGLEKSIDNCIKEIELSKIENDDKRNKTRIIKKYLQKIAEEESVDLKLRKTFKLEMILMIIPELSKIKKCTI
jgi:hypothetical protein